MTTDTTQDPCRIFGVAAPAVPVVVLLRRGPTRWAQMVQYFKQYGSPYVLDWEIVDTAKQQTQRIEQAEWADWDWQGRLIFTRQGQVWPSLPDQYPQGALCLADLNGRRPDPQPSPAWASQWP